MTTDIEFRSKITNFINDMNETDSFGKFTKYILSITDYYKNDSDLNTKLQKSFHIILMISKYFSLFLKFPQYLKQINH